MAKKDKQKDPPSDPNQPQPKKPKRSHGALKQLLPGSKAAANGNATLNDSTGFYHDEETWINIYYILSSKLLDSDATYVPPPTTRIVALFNAFFQGYKEPVGECASSSNERRPYLTCTAVPRRTKKTFSDFDSAAERMCSALKAKVEKESEARNTTAVTEHTSTPYTLVITPAILASVLADPASLPSLLIPPTWAPDKADWVDTAIANLQARPHRSDANAMHWHRDYARLTWNPTTLPAETLINGPQMVMRKDYAAEANALVNICPVPPLGFFGDLRELKEGDFVEEVFGGVEVEMAEGRRVETRGEVMKRERRKFEVHVGVLKRGLVVQRRGVE